MIATTLSARTSAAQGTKVLAEAAIGPTHAWHVVLAGERRGTDRASLPLSSAGAPAGPAGTKGAAPVATCTGNTPRSLVWRPAPAPSGRMTNDEGLISQGAESPQNLGRRPAGDNGDGQARPQDQESQQAPAGGGDCHHRPCRPRPHGGGRAGQAAGGGGSERRREHQRPVPESWPATAHRRRDPARRRRRNRHLREGYRR